MDQPAEWKLNSVLLSCDQSVKLVAAAFSLKARSPRPDLRTGDMFAVLEVGTGGDLSNGGESATQG